MNDSTRSALIYGLFDLSDPYRRVRYVGQTIRPIAERQAQHLAAARRHEQTAVYRLWLSNLESRNLGVILLEECAPSEKYKRERYWITALKTRIELTGFNDELIAGKPSRNQTQAGHPSRIAAGQAMRATHAADPSIGQRMGQSISAAWQDPESSLRLVSQANLGIASVFAAHTRWHVNRELVKTGCEFCEKSSPKDCASA